MLERHYINTFHIIGGILKKKKEKWYDGMVDNTKSCTKTAFRVTKLTVIGSCLMAAAMPMAYMSMCEECLDNFADKLKLKDSDDASRDTEENNL